MAHKRILQPDTKFFGKHALLVTTKIYTCILTCTIQSMLYVLLLPPPPSNVGVHMCLKGPYADHILIPQGSTGSSTFFDIKWAHIFLFANPKFQLQILCSFGDTTKNVKLNGIPENNLCIFIIASSPGVHTFFCLWRVNKKLPQGETSQNAFQRSRSIN